MQHIFISYSHQDKDYAKRLVSEIEEQGIQIWFDERIDYGDRWFQTIINAIRESVAIIVLMTPEAEASGWVQREILVAQRHNKPILPLLLKGNAFDILLDVQYINAIDYQLPPEDFYTKLKKFYKVPNIAGQWINPTNNNTVFFNQMGKRVVGIYDFGEKHKVAMYQGTIEQSTLNYRWHWFTRSLDGYGRMSITETEQRMSGIWWYGTKEMDVKPVSYIKVSDEMPAWLTTYDFDEYKYFLRGKE
jgi:TIR domain